MTGIGTPPLMRGLDQTDRAILSELRQNSRRSYIDIAAAVGVSERTVRTRVKRLEESGIIRSYTVRESGLGVTALIRIEVRAGAEIGSLGGEIAHWEGVESVYEVSGEADLVAVAHADDTQQLRALLDRIAVADPDVLSTTTELVLEQY